MASAAFDRLRARWAPARPGWLRLSVLTTILLLGWALLAPVGAQPQWWHWVLGGAVALGFIGSWHGQHLSTSVRRWLPMTWRNRSNRGAVIPSDTAGLLAGDAVRARIVIQLRPHPHALTAEGDDDDQLPWEFVTAWLSRYGIHADALMVCSVTRTPPPSSLRSDVGATVTARTPQHRETWLTYTLSADSNVAALTARKTTIASPDGDDPDHRLQRATLADVVTRRLIAELRERGWMATVCSDPAGLPVFVPDSVHVLRECWTGTEYSDGYRAVYTVDPNRLRDVLDQLPNVPVKATWCVVSLRARGEPVETVGACVGLVTTTRPPMLLLPGLSGYHGLHRQASESLSITGLAEADRLAAPRRGESAGLTLPDIRWPTGAFGVPMGRNRNRQPVYLGLQSPETVRVTVAGSSDFHVGIVGRIALSGLPIAVYSAASGRWVWLVNRAAPGQIQLNPPTVGASTIVVSDGSVKSPPAAFTVSLRQRAGATAATTIVINQDSRRADLFTISTPRASEWLSTQL